MRVRSLVVTFLALLPLLALHGPASGQGYPPSAGSLVLGVSEAPAGGTTTVNGGGCPPNSKVTMEFRAPVVALPSIQADAAGNFSTTVAIPAGASPGERSIVAICASPAGAQRELSSVVDVLGEQVSRSRPSGRDLPRTGTDAVVMAIAGAALVAVGGLAVATSRRKRTPS